MRIQIHSPDSGNQIVAAPDLEDKFPLTLAAETVGHGCGGGCESWRGGRFGQDAPVQAHLHSIGTLLKCTLNPGHEE